MTLEEVNNQVIPSTDQSNSKPNVFERLSTPRVNYRDKILKPSIISNKSIDSKFVNRLAVEDVNKRKDNLKKLLSFLDSKNSVKDVGFVNKATNTIVDKTIQQSLCNYFDILICKQENISSINKNENILLTISKIDYDCLEPDFISQFIRLVLGNPDEWKTITRREFIESLTKYLKNHGTSIPRYYSIVSHLCKSMKERPIHDMYNQHKSREEIELAQCRSNPVLETGIITDQLALRHRSKANSEMNKVFDILYECEFTILIDTIKFVLNHFYEICYKKIEKFIQTR
jgi:hypothetical protein